jgi:hypothetical protein
MFWNAWRASKANFKMLRSLIRNLTQLARPKREQEK